MQVNRCLLTAWPVRTATWCVPCPTAAALPCLAMSMPSCAVQSALEGIISLVTEGQQHTHMQVGGQKAHTGGTGNGKKRRAKSQHLLARG